MQTEILPLDADSAQRELPALLALLQDAVEGGATLGFVLPFDAALAQRYWEQVIADLAIPGRRYLWAAWLGDELMGTAQLEPSPKQNATHRAEVQKLMVHRAARRLRIGENLMLAIEAQALELGRPLLYLDTEKGSEAEHFYRRLGYIYCGGIPGFSLSVEGLERENSIYYKRLS
jgi:GNAT superfamily N-acetyltransferase